MIRAVRLSAAFQQAAKDFKTTVGVVHGCHDRDLMCAGPAAFMH